MRKIPLTKGLVTLVDNDDYEWLRQWKWYAHRMGSRHTFYARSNIRITKGKQRRTSLSMHRLILGLQPGDKRQCDHRDRNGLNNVLSNLRISTVMQNQQHQKKQTKGTSKYKGVYWHSRDRKWLSRIQVNKKRIHLGLFDSEIDAAYAYDLAAIKNFGDFALINKISGGGER